MKKLLVRLCVVFIMHSQVNAETNGETIISCGANNGYSYFFSGQMVPKSK